MSHYAASLQFQKMGITINAMEKSGRKNMSTETTAELVKAARDAVAELDEPLRTEAFKIVLDRLLGGGAMRSENRQPAAAKRLRKTARSKLAQTKKDVSAAIPATTLKLSVDDLKRLKAYCDGLDLQGAEQAAFALVNFAREHLNRESVNANDVAYLHRQLISQKIKVVGVNGAASWSRALGWLTVPSRKREWLERAKDGGFSVSNAGLIQWNEIEEQRKKRRGSASHDKTA